jgi:hypothetical protein
MVGPEEEECFESNVLLRPPPHAVSGESANTSSGTDLELLLRGHVLRGTPHETFRNRKKGALLILTTSQWQ